MVTTFVCHRMLTPPDGLLQGRLVEALDHSGNILDLLRIRGVAQNLRDLSQKNLCRYIGNFQHSS